MAAYTSWDFVDASLTETGWAQTLSLRRHFQQLAPPPSLDIVVVSPLTRTLQTACSVFGAPLKDPAAISDAEEDAPLLMLPTPEGRPAISSRGAPPFVATELCREHMGLHPCDKRKNISEYRKTFPAVDFSQVRLRM